ncbi:MAG: hypothetical protein MJY53_06540 [Bacteroidales bacterium]|nr:hypothetical protein [Bacteroidales bacterium]
MKKIIRIASVIALLGASLLYVGCTKDFSADLAKTNSEVAAQASKVAALEATVQTINSTVENLKTTKADAAAVNALQADLEKKIDVLAAALEQTALLAASAQADADAVAADLEVEKARLDTVIAIVEDLAVESDSLRKDVDSLYKNSAALESRIAELEGRVDALAARITSIVAVPSEYPEIQRYQIDTIAADGSAKKGLLDTTLFQATFAISPAEAAKTINAKDLSVVVKSGLTKPEEPKDAEIADGIYPVKEIVAVNGDEITVISSIEFKAKTKGPADDPKLTPYYSLVFVGEDLADSTYEQRSEFVKAHANVGPADKDGKKIKDLVSFVRKSDNKPFKEFTDEEKAEKNFRDTLAFNGEEGVEFYPFFSDFEVKFDVDGALISVADFAKMIGVKAANLAVKPDTAIQAAKNANPLDWKDTSAVNTGIFVGKSKTVLNGATKDNVGDRVKIEINKIAVGGEKDAIKDIHFVEQYFVGAKTVSYTIPATSEPWTYTSWNTVSRTVNITDGALADSLNKYVPEDGFETGNFKLEKATKGVKIIATEVARSKEAKDTTYKVQWANEIVFVPTGVQDTVQYKINWDYIVKGRPADAAIALGEKDTLVTKFNQNIKVPVEANAIDLTFAALANEFSVTTAGDSAAIKSAIKSAVPALDSVLINGRNKTEALANKVTVAYDAVTLPATSQEGIYTVVFHSTVFGIKYTYTFVIELTRPANIKLHATPYVSAGVAKVDADTTGTTYTLKNIDFAKYVNVFSADTLAKGFEGYKVTFKAEREDSSLFANDGDTTLGDLNKYAWDTTAVKNGIIQNPTKLNWSEYTGREVKVTAYLWAPSDTAAIDSLAFTLKYDKPITSFTAGTQTVKRVAGQDTKVTLRKSFDIKGIYHGEKNIIVDTTGLWIDGYNYYDCDFTYDWENAVFKVDGTVTTFTKGVDYKIEKNPYNGHDWTLVIIGDNNNKPVEVSVPVTLGYHYDYNGVQAYKDNLVIKVE